MSNKFVDPYPDKPKILFIAYAYSSHTRNWIDLLQDEKLNIRVFSMPNDRLPPKDWKIPTYISYSGVIPDEENLLDARTRIRLHPKPSRYLLKRIFDKVKRKLKQYIRGSPSIEKWLAQIIREWQPDIVHTLAYEASSLYLKVREQNTDIPQKEIWLFSLWGAGDTEFQKAHPKTRKTLQNILSTSDYVFSDNSHSIEVAIELGLQPKQIPRISVLPGAGGIDVDALRTKWDSKTSDRRLILWPKAYDSPYASSLTVFEALKLAWEHIQPCEVQILMGWEGTAISKWYWTLPEAMRQTISCQEHVPHEKLMVLMLRARVMLAPSLLDGMPNTLLEAMACGAFPIVSPLESIQTLVQTEENVLFTRNLYPQEIADALIRTMNDDTLVDKAAQQNIKVVRQFAHRPDVQKKAIAMYNSLLHVE